MLQRLAVTNPKNDKMDPHGVNPINANLLADSLFLNLSGKSYAFVIYLDHLIETRKHIKYGKSKKANPVSIHIADLLQEISCWIVI